MNKRKRPEYFDMSLGEMTFKKAEKEATLVVQRSLFDREVIEGVSESE